MPPSAIELTRIRSGPPRWLSGERAFVQLGCVVLLALASLAMNAVVAARAEKLSALLLAMLCVSASVIILSVVFAAQSFSRMVSERDVRLSQKDNELAAKDLMMREVDHRARNSLCLVHSLMTFQGQRSGNDGKTKTLLAEAANQVLVVARVHERLYRTRRSDRVPLDAYLREICDDVADNALPPDESGLIEVDSVDLELPAEQAIWLGLVVVELVTNALKHGDPVTNGPVRVEVAQGDGSLSVAVSDRGHGLPADFDIKRAKGLGMQIVSLLVKQLRATLSLDRGARGARFVLSVPLADEAQDRVARATPASVNTSAAI